MDSVVDRPYYSVDEKVRVDGKPGRVLHIYDEPQGFIYAVVTRQGFFEVTERRLKKHYISAALTWKELMESVDG